MIFLVLVTNLLLISTGTILSWILRVAQLIGGIYLFLATIAILKEAEIRQISPDKALASFFQERQQNLNLLFENLTDAIIVNDPNFIITGWNKGAEKIYG